MPIKILHRLLNPERETDGRVYNPHAADFLATVEIRNPREGEPCGTSFAPHPINAENH